MPKLKQKFKKPLRELNQPPNGLHVLQANRSASDQASKSLQANQPATAGDDLGQLSSALDDQNCPPGEAATTSALYDELQSFRQRWRRELEQGLESRPESEQQSSLKKTHHQPKSTTGTGTASDPPKSNQIEDKPSTGDNYNADPTYAEAKRLFLIAVDLERDDMHHESIRYYKKSMHLCPDIEKRIFKEQCEASKQMSAPKEANKLEPQQSPVSHDQQQQQSTSSLLERISHSFQQDSENQDYSHCRPLHKVKTGTLHLSDLPYELMAKIVRHVVGGELDLASLEQVGMVCRGLYLLSREKSLWMDICLSTWGPKLKKSSDIDWRQMFLDRPRVNFDGVYISRTRYFRQGDVGFQDITYRPFHVVRYYRYLRFFPNSRVLILTTNEEPEKIVPIFRHALNAKQFSPEIPIMEGEYEFTAGNQICIRAEKNSRITGSSQNYRRQAQFHWSRQTPITQSFILKFELKTVESKPYRNNVLRWLDYTIVTRLETGQEVTNFDMNPDTFPNLIFSRVKRFNLRSANPLSSH